MPGEIKDGLGCLFEPKSIAVAGVSTDPDKMGSIIFSNLLDNRDKGILRARVYALNPAHEAVAGQRAYPSIGALPEVPDLLIVTVPASQTVGVVEAAAKAGVRATIIITSGYAEAGRRDVEGRIAELAAQSGMRVLGPNTIGVVDLKSGVDSLFLRPTKALPGGGEISSLIRPTIGGVVIVTQSGHLGQALVEELAAEGVGIRAIVGTGNQVDVSVEDVMEYFADDPQAKVIALYIEGLKDGRRFMDLASRISRRKPVIAFKSGKTAGGAKAAITHTASLVGDYAVYKAAFRQSGVVEADTLQELADYSVALSTLPRPSGNRLAIVTNAGGVGAIATDEALRSGLRVDGLSSVSRTKLRSEFTNTGFIANAALGNPIDLTASATTDEFVKAVRKVAAMPEFDLLLVMPTHQTPAIAPDVSLRLAEALKETEKPVCMAIIGRSDLAAKIHRELAERGIPSFPTPERAVRALAASWKYSGRRQTGLRYGLGRRDDGKERRPRPLNQGEVEALLTSYGIVGPPSTVVSSRKEIPTLMVKPPVACKLVSRDLPHKTDAGGVVLGVKTLREAAAVFEKFRRLSRRKGLSFDGMLVQEMVKDGVELILGCVRDQSFGPVVLVGLGGIYAEQFHEVSAAVAPVTPGGAKAMLEGTKLREVFQGYRRGGSVSLAELCRTVSAFSRIMPENGSIREIEVNPLTATSVGFLAVDSRASAAG